MYVAEEKTTFPKPAATRLRLFLLAPSKPRLARLVSTYRLPKQYGLCLGFGKTTKSLLHI